MSAVLSWTVAFGVAHRGAHACFSYFPGSGLGVGLGTLVCHMSCEAGTQELFLFHCYIIWFTPPPRPPKHTLLYFSF